MINRITGILNLLFNRYPRLVYKQVGEGGSAAKFLVSSPVEKWRIESLDGEEKIIEILLTNLRKDDIFFDVGSCLGLYSILVSKKGIVSYAFDPDPNVYSHMLNNIKINKLQKKIIPFRCAISDKQGNIPFYVLAKEEKSSSMINKSDMRVRIKVPTVSIDHLIKSKKVKSPTIIKMDIEGAEALAVKGMKTLMRSNQKPRMLIIEVHPEFIKKFNDTPASLIKLILNCGYGEYYSHGRNDEKNYIFMK